ADRARARRGFGRFVELVELRPDADIDASIALASLRRLVVRDRPRLAVADRADAKRLDSELARQVPADGLRALPRKHHVRFVAAVRVGVTFDDDLGVGEDVDRLPNLLEQRPVLGIDVRASAREREADEAHDDLVAFARDACFVAREHSLDRVELLAHARLGFEALNQRGPFLRNAAEPLVELADLVLELRDALAARREVERGLALALAQILD